MTFEQPFLRALFLLQLTLAAACGSSSSHGNAGATDGAGGSGGKTGAGTGMPAGSGGSGAAGGGGGAGGGNADPCAKSWLDVTNTGIPAGTPAVYASPNSAILVGRDGRV